MTLLQLINVVQVAGQLFAANAPWFSYVSLFGVALFGYFVCRLVYWDDVQ